MGIAVLVIGASGSGKSTSLRNFKPEDVGVFNVAGKPLPFRNRLATVNSPNYDTIIKMLKLGERKSYVIDDSQYLMAFESFAHAKETGYGKFTNMAINFYKLVQTAIQETPSDTIVYFLHHTETADDGRLKAKTLGKMIDSQLTLEGLFSIVLLCQTDGSDHNFITNSDGSNPNDLKFVDDTIRDYYGIKIEREDK